MTPIKLSSVHKRKFDLLVIAITTASFAAVTSIRLGDVPVPDTDESYMLQTSYEMIYRGNLALPFRRLLGGNIETTWHSFTPLHYVIQSGFLKVFGWGLLQGRVFNLIMSSLMLVMLYLIGRKLLGWRTGLIAVLLVLCDVTFLERSRYLRNDYSAAVFALLAFYFYEVADHRKSWRWYVACGVAAGAALMTHTTGLYMVLAIPVLMLVRRGWRVLTTGGVYQYGFGAFTVSAYEIIYDLIDYKNVALQNRGDKRHFKVLEAMGWWKNIRHEPRRYYNWYSGARVFKELPRSLLHLFQLLAAIGICYLIVRLFVHLKRGNARKEPRVRVLVVTWVAVTFFAVVTSQKAIYYVAQLGPWFALCAAILVADALDLASRLGAARPGRWKPPKFAYAASVAVLIIAGLGAGYLGLKQTKRYLRAVRNPDNASFEEFKTAIRSLVPQGVCPVAVRGPVLWLAFPEHDLCFANIQRRTRKAADIDGKEFALIVEPGQASYWVEEIARENHHLVGKLIDTPYGSYDIYYTGVDPRWQALEPMRYQFFGARRGYASGKEIDGAREIWSADAGSLKHCGAPGEVESDGLAISTFEKTTRRDGIVELCALELKPNTIYYATVEGTADPERWAVVIVDNKSGAWVLEQKLGERVEVERFSGLFKTGANNQFKLGVRPLGQPATSALRLTRISIREVAPVYR